MNNKIGFISDTQVEPVEIVAKRLSEYTQVVRTLDVHYDIRGRLLNKWNDIIDEPEFTILEEDGMFKIRAKSDRIVLASVDDKNLAENIVILMNLAFREGAKQIIRILENL